MFVFVLRGARAKRGYFHGIRAEHYMHDLKAPPYKPRTPKELMNSFGRRIGRDIKILGGYAKQQITYRAADHVGLISRVPQSRTDAQCRRRKALTAHAVFGYGNFLGTFCAATAQYPMDEFLDQELTIMFFDGPVFRAAMGLDGE